MPDASLLKTDTKRTLPLYERKALNFFLLYLTMMMFIRVQRATVYSEERSIQTLVSWHNKKMYQAGVGLVFAAFSKETATVS